MENLKLALRARPARESRTAAKTEAVACYLLRFAFREELKIAWHPA